MSAGSSTGLWLFHRLKKSAASPGKTRPTTLPKARPIALPIRARLLSFLLVVQMLLPCALPEGEGYFSTLRLPGFQTQAAGCTAVNGPASRDGTSSVTLCPRKTKRLEHGPTLSLISPIPAAQPCWRPVALNLMGAMPTRQYAWACLGSRGRHAHAKTAGVGMAPKHSLLNRESGFPVENLINARGQV